MLKEKVQVQSENLGLLMEIFDLKVNLEELYEKKGPVTSDYISLSIKLDYLMKEYFEEKIGNFINTSRDQLIEICEDNGCKYPETINASQRLSEIISKYQKLRNFV